MYLDGTGEPLRCWRDARLAPLLPVPARMFELIISVLAEVASKVPGGFGPSPPREGLLGLPPAQATGRG